MIEEKCLSCGGPVFKPDPPARTTQERRQFERDWDARFEEKNPDWRETRPDRFLGLDQPFHRGQ